MWERSVSRALQDEIDINFSSQLVWLYFSDWLNLIVLTREKITNSQPRLILLVVFAVTIIQLEYPVITRAVTYVSKANRYSEDTTLVRIYRTFAILKKWTGSRILYHSLHWQAHLFPNQVFRKKTCPLYQGGISTGKIIARKDIWLEGSSGVAIFKNEQKTQGISTRWIKNLKTPHTVFHRHDHPYYPERCIHNRTRLTEVVNTFRQS